MIPLSCQPSDPIKPLFIGEVHDFLVELKKDWDLIGEDQAIRHEFKFKNFQKALQFINQVGGIAEQENHHPDINLHGWNKVTVTLKTHACKGLSVNDFVIAKKIEAII